MHRSRGFTLIEMLVVMVVLGIVVAMLLPKLGDLGDNRDLERDARRLAALMGLAGEEAVMQSREFGIRFSENAYAFYDLDFDSGAWVEIANDETLRSRELPADTRFQLWIEDQEVVLEAELPTVSPAEVDDEEDDDGRREAASTRDIPPPQVLLFSSGESTPFQLLIEEPYSDMQLIITGDEFGGLDVSNDPDTLRR